MKLYSQSYPSDLLENRDDGSTPVVIVPGLFGSTSNWRGFANSLSSHWPVMVLDPRNHGRSPHAETHSYHDLASDLLSFLNDHDIDKIKLCGHSMGGKASMVFSLLYPERVDQLVVLDIAPVVYTHTHAPYLEAMIDLDLASIGSRAEADKRLSKPIPDNATRLFLLQSLVGSAGNFKWRLNLSTLLKEMPNIIGFPEIPRTSDVNALFVGGQLSNYLSLEHHLIIKEHFPQASFEQISKAGHWLHAEQPQAVLAALLNFLNKR